MFVRVENGEPVEWPVREFQIRSHVYPSTLPDELTLDVVRPLGFELYDADEPPTIDGRVQELVEGKPTASADGVWKSNWIVVEAFSPEEKIRVLRKYEERYVRTTRNERLSRSDWTQASDWNPPGAVDRNAWAVYRQALRDITLQPGFPFEVEWPEEPRLEP